MSEVKTDHELLDSLINERDLVRVKELFLTKRIKKLRSIKVINKKAKFEGMYREERKMNNHLKSKLHIVQLRMIVMGADRLTLKVSKGTFSHWKKEVKSLQDKYVDDLFLDHMKFLWGDVC